MKVFRLAIVINNMLDDCMVETIFFGDLDI